MYFLHFHNSVKILNKCQLSWKSAMNTDYSKVIQRVEKAWQLKPRVVVEGLREEAVVIASMVAEVFLVSSVIRPN